MRVLVVVLLAANLLFFCWSRGWLDPLTGIPVQGVREPQRVQRLRDNVAYARRTIRDAGFEVLESPTAICPIIVHDTAKAIAMSRRLLELGVFVIGFGYPVVPEGHARLRCQVSAAHERTHLDAFGAALRQLRKEFA